MRLECDNGHDYLGAYPADFVKAVAAEGTGRITSGPHAGMYLNWSGGVGYWLDTSTRDTRGMPLRPFVSAAADPSIPFGTPLTIVACGVDDTTGGPIDPAVCNQLKGAAWVVSDRFTSPLVGQHLDLYIGEEDRPGFTNTNPTFVSLTSAVVSLGSTPASTSTLPSTTLPPTTTTTIGGPPTSVVGVPGPPPVLVAMALGTGRGVRLAWAPPRSAGGTPIVGYRIERATSGGDFAVLVDTGATRSYVDATAAPATVYLYRVSAVNAAGAGGPSPVAQATTR